MDSAVLALIDTMELPDLERELMWLDRLNTSESFREYVKLAWPLLEPATPFIDNWHIDCMCLPYSSLIITRDGEKPIGEVVEHQWSGEVLSWNESARVMEWRKVVRTFKNPGRLLIQIRLANGQFLETTENHPVYVKGAGYVTADAIQIGDTLRTVQPLSSNQFNGKEVLQSGMLPGLSVQAHAALSTMWERILTLARASARWLVQQDLFRKSENKAKFLQGLWRGNIVGSQQAVSSMFLQVLQAWQGISMQGMRSVSVCDAWEAQVQRPYARSVLQSDMLWEFRPWRKVPFLRQWECQHSLPISVSPGKAKDIKERITRLLHLLYENSAFIRASRRCESDEQRRLESCGTVPSMPCNGAWEDGRQWVEGGEVVVGITRAVSATQYTYNIEVAGNHNYFAERVLVHNCDHLQAVSHGAIKRLIINVPPGSSKSLVACVFWPTWHWTKWPEDRFMTASYTDVLSIRDALKSRRLIQSSWYRALWGDKFRLTGDQNAKSRYENDKTGYRIATHVGGATGERARYRVLDDPHNIDEAESDTIRESAVTWVRSTWAERESHAKEGGDVVVMQRLHDRDVCGYLLHEVGGYEHVMIPMRYEAKRKFVTVVQAPSGAVWTDPRTVEGELLCPARWDEEDVKLKEKRLGIYAASGQLQQRPSPEHGGILKRHWFKYWQHPGDALPPVTVKLPDGSYREIAPVDLPYTFDQTMASWDMTFKGTVGTDYVVGGQYNRKAADTFFIDQSRAHRDFPDTLREVRDFHAKHQRYHGKILIEDKANGPAIISTLRREIPGIVPHPGNDDKIARAHAQAYVVEGGNFYVPHPQIAPWVDDFIEELCVYPNGAHDDQCVSWSMAMAELYEIEDKGIQITPQYAAKWHQASKGMEPVQGCPSFRFWYQGVYPCCVVGQTLSSGRIILIDCVLGEQSTTIEQLIDQKVIPLLNADYRGCTEWRDITNHGPLHAKSEPTEHHLDNIIRAKLDGTPEPGEPDFFTRLNGIVGLLSQTGRLTTNPAPSPGEAKPWIYEALSGGYAYRKDQSGVISRSEARRHHPLTSVGEAIGHGLSRLFQRVPPPKSRNKQTDTKRANQYSV